MKTIDLKLDIKNSPACIAVLDKEMRFTDYSTRFTEGTKLENKDLNGQRIFDVFKAFPEEFRYNGQDDFPKQLLLEKIEKHSCKECGTKWYKWKVYTMTDDVGEHLGFTVIREDHTASKRREELMAKSLEVARIGGWEVDLINNEVHWTEVTKEIHEVDEDYVPNLEEGINFYKEGYDRVKIAELVSEAIRTGNPWDTELRIITATGKEVWVRAKGEADMLKGKCIRLFGTFQDIDEKKKAELKYQEVSERMAIANQAATIGVWDYNVVDNKLVWDDNMYKLYGIRREDFSGVYEAWETAVHPEDQEDGKKAIQMAISGEKEFDTEFRVVWPNGEERHIKAFAITHRDEQGKALRMIGTNWDITEKKKNEKKLKNLLDISSEQNKSLMNFAHIVSHNLRSHASNMSMLTGFLTKEEKEEEKLNLVRMLDEAAESLNETVQTLNEVVQVKTGTAEKIKPVNLLKTVKAVEKNLSILMKETNTECELDIDEGLEVNAIKAYLDSVLLNLFTNSIKYKSPERDLKICVKAVNEDGKVLLSFKDNGLGIDLERFGDKIFGMYKTFHRHKDAKGIGLFITKNQMESMNGRIGVESTVGEGTTFKLEFLST